MSGVLASSLRARLRTSARRDVLTIWGALRRRPRLHTSSTLRLGSHAAVSRNTVWDCDYAVAPIPIAAALLRRYTTKCRETVNVSLALISDETGCADSDSGCSGTKYPTRRTRRSPNERSCSCGCYSIWTCASATSARLVLRWSCTCNALYIYVLLTRIVYIWLIYGHSGTAKVSNISCIA